MSSRPSSPYELVTVRGQTGELETVAACVAERPATVEQLRGRVLRQCDAPAPLSPLPAGVRPDRPHPFAGLRFSITPAGLGALQEADALERATSSPKVLSINGDGSFRVAGPFHTSDGRYFANLDDRDRAERDAAAAKARHAARCAAHALRSATIAAERTSGAGRAS